MDIASLNTAGVQTNARAELPSVSDDGRYVCFRSAATNLVPGDLDIHSNIFVRDRLLSTTRRVDVSLSGAAPNSPGDNPEISADGRSIAFNSQATNLIPHALNWNDVFLARHLEQAPAVYCTATQTSHGCLPAIAWAGTCSVSSASGFNIRADHVDPDRFAALFYGHIGPSAVQIPGGILCVGMLPKRTPLLRTQGSGPCGGTLDYDFNAWIAAGYDPALFASQSVWAQFWIRDPQSVRKLNLTDAVYFVIGP
jgi:hypothetical protein